MAIHLGGDSSSDPATPDQTQASQFANEHLLYDGASISIPSQDAGITRYDTVIVPSNNPSEDYMSTTLCQLPSSTWFLSGVFDGHNGTATSSFLSQNLIEAVVGALVDLFSKHGVIPDEHTEPGTGCHRPAPEDIDVAIKETFKKIDDDIVNWATERALKQVKPSLETPANLLATASAGSCALLAFYESGTRLLRVAVTGDSRAVLGRRTKNEQGKDTYEVHVLSVDQNAHNPAEEERMNILHPGEQIFRGGRVLGWGISRAFGNGSLKWSNAVQNRLDRVHFMHRDPERMFLPTDTPPYMTAEPEITTTEVRPGDFLVLASDGLWDSLTSEEAVGLVGLWLEKNSLVHQDADSAIGSLRADADFDQIVQQDELPVKLKGDNPFFYRGWRIKKSFVNVDKNVASHLARNALGGANRKFTASLLDMIPPHSREKRDDISVNVVFFNED